MSSPTTLNVPGDHASMSEALTAAKDGDTIHIEGRLESPHVRVEKEITLTGDTLVGLDPVAIGLFASATISGLRVENPQGHGVVSMAGTPLIEEVTLHVGQTAFACGSNAAPTIRRCAVETCRVGLSAQDTAAPDVQGLTVSSRGTGLLLRGESAGTFREVGIVAGQMAGVEVTDRASPILEQVAVALGGAGGMFLHGASTPKLRACLVKSVQLSGIEVSETANPTLDGIQVSEVRGSGLFLHGKSRGTYMDLHIESCGMACIEVSEEAAPEIEGGSLRAGEAHGLWIREQARAEVLSLSISHQGAMGVQATERAWCTLEDCCITMNRDHGLFTKDQAQVALVRCEISENAGHGVFAGDTSRVSTQDNRIAENAGGDLQPTGNGQIEEAG